MSNVLGPKPRVNNPNIIAATLAANSSSMRTALGVMSSAEVASAIESGSGVTSVGVSSTDFIVSGSPVTDAGTLTIDLATTGVDPGVYQYPTITIDSKGRISNANVDNPPVTTFNSRSGAVTLQDSDIVSGHTGNRFVFQGNNFGTGTVVDATSTYYEVTGNYTTGTQLAKGGTVARTDGLYASSAPTSGSWIR